MRTSSEMPLREECMRVEFFGIEIAPTTPLARWLVAGAIALSLAFFFVHASQRGKQLSQQIERIAGFDLPAGLKPVWTQRREDRTITLAANGIEFSKPFAQGYRLEETQARQLMDSCVERGGQLVDRAEITPRYPLLTRRLHYSTPVCMRTHDRPTHAVSLLQGDQLVVQIASP